MGHDEAMSRRNKGFNNPFADLHKTVKPVAEAAPAKPEPKPPPSVPDEDDDLIFARAMAGVTPQEEQEHRVEPKKTLSAPEQDDDALALAELQSFVRGDGPFELEDAGEGTSGRAHGVSAKILHKLRQGAFAFDHHIDLHGHTRAEAHIELGRFIINARRDGERCVLVVTGRGKSSPGGLSVLRDTLPRWLSREPIAPHVLAFCTARPVDGGSGAFYILLRRAGVRPYGTPK